jgi:hypothetical protein
MAITARFTLPLGLVNWPVIKRGLRDSHEYTHRCPGSAMMARKPANQNWESFVEQQIREAQQNGAFDNLPGFGGPMPDLGDPSDDLWWLKRKMRRENLSLMPASLEIRVDVDQTLRSLSELTSEAEVRQAVVALNERIRRANFAAVSGPPSTTMPLDVDQVVERWRAARSHDCRKK